MKPIHDVNLLRSITGLAALLIITEGASASGVPPLLGTITGPDYLVSVDRTTAFGTRIGHLGINFDEAMTGLEYDRVNGVLYGATSANVPDLYTVNPVTGLATRVGVPGTLGVLVTGMAYDPIDDILYAAGGDRFFRKNLYSINRATGASTLLGAVAGISDSIQGLAFDPQLRTLYALDELAPSGARIVTINIGTLTATPLTGNIRPGQVGWNGLAFDPFTGGLFANSNTTLFRINPITKSITTVGLTYSPELHTYGSLTVIAPFPIPEPSSGLLAIFALWLGMWKGIRSGSVIG